MGNLDNPVFWILLVIAVVVVGLYLRLQYRLAYLPRFRSVAEYNRDWEKRNPDLHAAEKKS